jgi:hypothetical protein
MMINKTGRVNLKIFLLLLASNFLVAGLNAQITDDTARDIRLYRPPAEVSKDTIRVSDSLQLRQQHIRDSVAVRQQFLRDSIEARLKFIQDSIIAREIFVRDSILRRQRILDSLRFLQTGLPRLIDASLRTLKEDMIIRQDKVKIVGDSVLSDYTYMILPFDLTRPFTPWKGILNLSDKPIKINVDEKKNKITSIQAPSLACSFSYGTTSKILVINEPGVIMNRREGKLYKVPFDTVFFDPQGRIIKIKRYIHFHRVENNYQKGAPVFIHLAQVKQFEYNAYNQMTRYQAVNFCDSWSEQEEKKVCYIITYSFDIRGNTYIITRQNNPSNDFSDGTYTCEFDDNFNLKSLAFKNASGSENWKTFVELNEAGNVSRYLYQVKDVVRQSMDIIYHPDDPDPKHKTELITNIFEDDGICYYQKNNNTGKSRTRDKMTGEWGPWR